jgi:hypothetical protein
MAEARPNSYEMHEEDQYRVARLYEEIRSRLEELALIGARVGGFTLTDEMVRKFVPQPSPEFEIYDVDVEIVCPPPDVGPCGCIYRDATGVWRWEQPCGSGPP